MKRDPTVEADHPFNTTTHPHQPHTNRSQLDCNSKQWRLFADVTNDVNLTLHLLGPLLPVPFLAVLCVSGVLTALVGVTGGSTRAALAVHQVGGVGDGSA